MAEHKYVRGVKKPYLSGPLITGDGGHLVPLKVNFSFLGQEKWRVSNVSGDTKDNPQTNSNFAPPKIDKPQPKKGKKSSPFPTLLLVLGPRFVGFAVR